ncbi:unnamed protein product [Notodromas monacha]|uniref:PID domain-containing protein n=1 Tax=Notodromas monacha TaxID=399045 RepID=A0A7R9BMT9_9CRUS|nr:unnamed protein product [Notodromas monacha]CAG0917025.1 unnamed protein product [Notodromas monacha]
MSTASDTQVESKFQSLSITRTDVVAKEASTPTPANQEISLPQTFIVKYLGKRDASGLWGIRHTREPIDELVAAAKALKRGMTLPLLSLEVSSSGIRIDERPGNANKDFEAGFRSIREISYGVQDLAYTRVFAMIVVCDGDLRDTHPFTCHGFVCDSRETARRLTFALSTAFKEYGEKLKDEKVAKPRKFAIDLRSPEEIQADLNGAQIDDSEA